MRRTRRERFLPIAVLLAAACNHAPAAPATPAASAQPVASSSNAEAVTPLPEPVAVPGVTQRELQHQGALFDVFELDLALVELRLYGQADPTLRRFATVRAKLDWEGVHWAVLTNGGMFHPGERPVGLHIEAGAQHAPLELADGEGNFFLKPNGVFYVDDRGAHVVPSDAYAPQGHVVLATQSGPLLLHDNAPHPRFIPDSPNRAKRSGIGTRDPSHVVIVVSRGLVSFATFATLFRDVLNCPEALYLDGTISDFDTPARKDASPQTYGSVLAAVARAP